MIMIESCIWSQFQHYQAWKYWIMSLLSKMGSFLFFWLGRYFIIHRKWEKNTRFWVIFHGTIFKYLRHICCCKYLLLSWNSDIPRILYLIWKDFIFIPGSSLLWVVTLDIVGWSAALITSSKCFKATICDYQNIFPVLLNLSTSVL